MCSPNFRRYSEVTLRSSSSISILPSFRTKMMSVEPLAQLDYAICILVRLHFRPADICTLLDIDSATLSMKRKRLLKKVYGMDGSAKDFDQRVLKIY